MNSGESTLPRSPIVCEILRYLIEHPEAKDTLEGIVEWWLLEQRIQREATRVKTALGDLAVAGFVRERKGRDGRVMYCVNPAKVEQIHAFLQEQKP